MKIKTIIIVLGMLVPILSLKAQEIKPLKIGDTVPDLILKHILNSPDTVAKLSDFDGKLVILDFFATWCTGCIANFPDMEGLQGANKEKLKIFIVSKPNNDSIASLTRFLKKPLPTTGKLFGLPIIAMDSVIHKYFPHRIIPHTIWLRNRKVIAITHSKALNRQSMELAWREGRYLGPTKAE